MTDADIPVREGELVVVVEPATACAFINSDLSKASKDGIKADASGVAATVAGSGAATAAAAW